jgi:hypothetical protein
LKGHFAEVEAFVNLSPKCGKQRERQVSISARFKLPSCQQQVQQGGGSRLGHAQDEHRPIRLREFRFYQVLELKAGGLDDL